MMENNAPSDSNQLYDLKDVKIDVMRARGAGGQVRVIFSKSNGLTSAYGYNSVYAR